MTQYEAAYRKRRGARKLEFLHQLGTVELELEMKSGEVLEVSCSVIQASVIECFGKQRTYRCACVCGRVCDSGPA